jgi:ribosome-binding factor A
MNEDLTELEEMTIHFNQLIYFCTMDTTRQQKVSRLLQKDLGEIFQREVSSFSAGAMITVTKVHVTKDLSIAKIYLSLFATSDKQKLLEEIKFHAGEIRYKLGRKIGKQVRVIPELHFYLDDSLDYIENIEKLLDND